MKMQAIDRLQFSESCSCSNFVKLGLGERVTQDLDPMPSKRDVITVWCEL